MLKDERKKGEGGVDGRREEVKYRGRKTAKVSKKRKTVKIKKRKGRSEKVKIKIQGKSSSQKEGENEKGKYVTQLDQTNEGK